MTIFRLSPPAEVRPRAAADAVRGLVGAVLGPDVPLRFEFWDGSVLDHPRPSATLRFTSPDAVRRTLWMPTELGLARAYVAGELEIDGDVFAAVRQLRRALFGRRADLARSLLAAIAAAGRIGALRPPLPPPPQEARLGFGVRHSLHRDSAAISHHYDVGNDFYRLVLGPSLTYSCARFGADAATLADAQAAKHELICRKLGLADRRGQRLLDVGCGWGSMAIHAARVHGAFVVGVTISQAQAELARQRADEAGVGDRVEIRLRDYRELDGETFDAVSSIGMAEHVGHAQLDRYFAVLRAALRPGGRLLNHAISSVGGSRISARSFVGRYVFPDGELVDLGDTVLAMERAGFEIRDVECLREHYARTLREWVANLDRDWDRAVELVGRPRAKVWRLYMAGAAVGFDEGANNLHQVLGVAPAPSGESGMPLTRRDWG